MGMPQIQDKLTKFLNSDIKLDREPDLVYFFVEVRKLIDTNSPSKYPILKFYCDWSVHTRKDHINTEMRNITKDIFDDIVSEIDKGWPTQKRKINSFMYMDELKKELIQFLGDHSLPLSLTEKPNWEEFITTFISILSDQPIIDPTDGIQSINIMPAARGVMICRVQFTKPVNGYNYYDYKNIV